ncbi:helix-turn-helix transcriptional regulator [Streptomyces sp. NPDC020298]|uniref:helix-turn-helix domain-containing protein n=1 Tax=unclassified Streptomyces TaxID=2593676 RepID=UPI003406EE79
MPPATTATLRQQRLGTELRRLRERAGLTSTAAAALLGGPQARISNIEAGRYAVSADRVRTLACNYSCADEEYVDALAAMTGGRKRGWWEEYRDTLPSGLLDLAELEHHATALRVAVTIHMPGLLQTPEHARATMREAVPPLRPHEIEHRVSYRVKRQAVLFENTPTPYTAIVHEAALRMGFGGQETARAQLTHLLEMSEETPITVLVLPFGQAGFPASGQPITYATGPVPRLDTVVLDTDHGCEFLDAEAQLDRYHSVLDRMEARALPESLSRDLIHRIAQDL